MRARPTSPRRRTAAKGRLVVTAAVAAVALVGGVVVAGPDAPVSRDDVQTVAVSLPTFQVGLGVNLNAATLAAEAGVAGAVITDVRGLPPGVTFDKSTGTISGSPTASGTYAVSVTGTVFGVSQTLNGTVTVNNADGSAPAPGTGTATGGATGTVSTGSTGADGVIAAVTGLLTQFTGGSGSTGTGTGTGGASASATASAGVTPTAPAGGSLGGLTGNMGSGSLGGATPTTTPAPTAPSSPAPSPAPTTPAGTNTGSQSGSTGTGTGNGTGTGTAGTDSLTSLLPGLAVLPLGSLGQTGSTGTGGATVTPTAPAPGTATGQTGSQTGSNGQAAPTGTVQVQVPGSSANTGSLSQMAPALALGGAALLGLAGLSIMLNGGSSTPGTTLGSAMLPVLPGSAAAAPVAPAAPAPAAPGPTVANGRG